jgi:hypothetical protein
MVFVRCSPVSFRAFARFGALSVSRLVSSLGVSAARGVRVDRIGPEDINYSYSRA